ncbi:transcription termination/antitermination protein NusA [Helicobacter muridarum]|uniref:Transcription termination/antitermination protein NusA n=1 Tax=Helicobacter muridarum TaxID=216 RepID=A0A099U183_9HELI|nr:transcription termination factor NusA [Helicobacter muridarum]TLE00769.1 transcription termination/antitermination protein NusA [Helicobacter muridarum]STQ86550.1 transcription elongation factor NusA [Helicobacter muridarum]
MEKILDIVEAIASENDVPKERVIEAIRESMINMAKREIDDLANFAVNQDDANRDLQLVQKMIVCSDEEFNEDLESTHIPLSEAKSLVDSVDINDELEYQINLESMNRNVVNQIFYEIRDVIQRINEEELLKKIEKDLHKIVLGNVISVDNVGNTSVEIGENRAILPLKNRIKGEQFHHGQTIRAILKYIGINRNGMRIELSRTTPKFLEELLKLEVPEIKDGDVQIHKIVRIPGEKAKVALYTNNPKIDPIGSAVGTKGVRINAVSKELHGENIDCIEYSSVPEVFVAKSLAPAQVISVKINANYSNNEQAQSQLQYNEKPIAVVHILHSQKSKAIGRSGLNIRLASMLTGYDIELVEIPDKEKNQSEQHMESNDIKSQLSALLPQMSESKTEDKKLDIEALKSLFKDSNTKDQN